MIYIGFSTNKSWISRAIMWFTRSVWSHAFIAFDWLGKDWVLEAGPVGVVVTPWDRFAHDKTNIKIIAVKISPDGQGVPLESLEPALNNLGLPYDYPGLFGGIVMMVGRWLKKGWRNPAQNPKAMFCSELVALWLQSLEYPGAEKLLPGDTSPQDLYEFLGQK